MPVAIIDDEWKMAEGNFYTANTPSIFICKSPVCYVQLSSVLPSHIHFLVQYWWYFRRVATQRERLQALVILLDVHILDILKLQDQKSITMKFSTILICRSMSIRVNLFKSVNISRFGLSPSNKSWTISLDQR